MNFVQFPFDDHVEFGDQLILQITYPLFSLLATASFAQSIKSYSDQYRYICTFGSTAILCTDIFWTLIMDRWMTIRVRISIVTSARSDQRQSYVQIYSGH
eukprot:559418_1